MADPKPAGDEAYRGFRITEMWAVTAVDPADDQEGICAIPMGGQAGGPLEGTMMPLVGSDRMRLQELLEPAAEMLRQQNPTVTIKRFALVDGDMPGRPSVDDLPAETNANLLEDPDFAAYVTHVQSELIPKLEKSSMTISLVPTGPSDIKFAIELGLSIMMGKPIMAVVPKGAQMPDKLRAVVDEVVEVDLGDSTAGPAIHAAIQRMSTRLGLA